MTTYCPTCNVEYSVLERKTHLRSDWHVYNLKRVVASLPPLSAAEFSKKQALFASTASGVDLPQVSKFAFEAQLKAVRSELPPERTADSKTSDTDHEESDSDSSFRQPLPIGACLFCDRSFAGCAEAVDRVLRHMSDAHGFTLPHADKLINPGGLLADLGRLVGVEFACIGCGRQFSGRTYGDMSLQPSELRRQNLAAVRAHMRDANHTFLYTGTNDPVQVMLAIAETDSEGSRRAESLPPVARVGGEFYSQFYVPERENKTLVLPDDPDDMAYEVRLPAGGVLGHRKHYLTVYRQNLASGLIEEAKRRQQLQMATLTHGGTLNIASRRGTGLAIASSSTADPNGGRISRVDAHRQAATKSILDKYDLDLGTRGNYVLRGHLRRQY
ncbi:unnamed protein product [Mesocestoides corti]|uniref:ZN622/Rei1/Reh1 zinc finger C2H2-type domain-containing protein n=1 Tax=Mesocestoides corti TaxID=53468 RepID=A0A0R3UG02_MESCO|nr:unnamed protein product [Mesocestoides corti]